MDNYGYGEDGRRRWLRIGAIAAGALVALALVFGIGRWTAPAASNGAQPTVRGQSGPGPTRVENGVPVGYAHTQDGAVAAATNYLMVVDGPLVTQPDKYRAAINTLAAPEARVRLRQHAEANIGALQTLVSYATQGRAVVHRGIPLAYKVDRYTGDVADVSIWAEGLIAVDGEMSMREIWSTTTVTAQWSNGDWRLSNIAATTPASYGPAPTITQVPVQTVTLPPQLATYRSYRADVSG
jgi:hypothetical protein